MSDIDMLDLGGDSPAALPNATPVLVLGIISLVGCFLYGIPGLVCGIIAIMMHKKDKALYDSNPGKYAESFKTSKAGQICGIVGVSLSAAFIAFLVFYVFFVFSIFSTVGRIH